MSTLTGIHISLNSSLLHPSSYCCFANRGFDVWHFFSDRGRFLDAGTGTHSLKWINTLDTEGFTAVTADTLFADTTRKEVWCTNKVACFFVFFCFVFCACSGNIFLCFVVMKDVFRVEEFFVLFCFFCLAAEMFSCVLFL